MVGINHDNSFGNRIIMSSVTNALFLQLRTEIDVQQLRDGLDHTFKMCCINKQLFLKSVMLICKWK